MSTVMQCFKVKDHALCSLDPSNIQIVCHVTQAIFHEPKTIENKLVSYLHVSMGGNHKL